MNYFVTSYPENNQSPGVDWFIKILIGTQSVD